jgi:hypothetical protein
MTETGKNDKNDNNYDRLWEIISPSDQLNNTCDFTIHLNIELWMKFLGSSKRELFPSNIYITN